jgi:transposase
MGRRAASKVIVFGVVKRNGCVKPMLIAAHNHVEIMREIQAHTREGVLYYTDEWQAFAMLRPRGEDVMIRKEKGRPLGCDHINGIEGSRGYAENWLYPSFDVPTKYFHLYLAEVCRRFNHRNQDTKLSLKQMLTTLTISEMKSVLVRQGFELPFERDPTYGHGDEILVCISSKNHRGSFFGAW